MHKRWSRIFALSMGMALMLAFLAACGAGTSPSGSSTGTVTIEIGSEFPTTQSDASSGKPAENGIRYAIDKANSANLVPGYKFVINAKDDVGANGTHATSGHSNISSTSTMERQNRSVQTRKTQYWRSCMS